MTNGTFRPSQRRPLQLFTKHVMSLDIVKLTWPQHFYAWTRRRMLFTYCRLKLFLRWLFYVKYELFFKDRVFIKSKILHILLSFLPFMSIPKVLIVSLKENLIFLYLSTKFRNTPDKSRFF